ncbi:helix-turn-helix domain-containing protein [Pseudonocardia sulfidoxydans]|uniref:helix-turn-helix domain-containing protein n=1 Tax=Pseudonocardia sulfidoxydans TaxID=54011 RepID=UPI0011BD8F52|nr:helix-turn-helix transcriptional regulator [Pseudonocardia sulfidoxydans]
MPTWEKLGAGLRAARRAVVLPSGGRLTAKELADRLGVSAPTISRVETGARHPGALLDRWLDETAAPDELRAELQVLAADTTELAAWRQLHTRGWETHQHDYAALERSATTIISFQNSLIPGLLQTAAYTSYLLETVVGLDSDETATAVRSRLDRQRLLYERGRTFRVVITEAVLRHRLGGEAIMAEQLRRLADLSRLPTVDLGVIPVDTDMASRYGASFDLYDGIDGTDDGLVVVELEAGELREHDPGKVEAYRRRHAIYWAAALTGAAAGDFVEAGAQRMESRIFG